MEPKEQYTGPTKGDYVKAALLTVAGPIAVFAAEIFPNLPEIVTSFAPPIAILGQFYYQQKRLEYWRRKDLPEEERKAYKKSSDIATVPIVTTGLLHIANTIFN